MPVPQPSWSGAPYQWEQPGPQGDAEPEQAEDAPLDLRVVALVVGVMVMAALLVVPALAMDVAGVQITLTAE